MHEDTAVAFAVFGGPPRDHRACRVGMETVLTTVVTKNDFRSRALQGTVRQSCGAEEDPAKQWKDGDSRPAGNGTPCFGENTCRPEKGNSYRNQ